MTFQPPPTSSGESARVAIGDIPAGLVNFDKLPDGAYVRVPTVAPIFGISIKTVWRWAKSGRLPAPKKLGPNVTAWNVGELRRALAQKAGQ
jgi:predicted DNA-binding transcriptional regulator AlpA